MKNRALLNVTYGVSSHLVKTILLFLSRKVFIYLLGIEVLGVNSLFTSVLSILSMTELGLGAAVAFSLYKPIADQNTSKIQGIVCLFRKAYRYIGIGIFAIGLCILPFIPNMVKTDVPIPYLRILFLIVIIKTSLTYLLFSFSQIILNAQRQKYIVDQVALNFYFVVNLTQIVFLYFTKSFMIYLLIDLIMINLQQYIIYRKAKKLYPDILSAKKVELSSQDRKEIWKNVYGLSINKIAGAIYTSVANVVLSVFISTAIVGIYSNYNMVLMAATGIISMSFTSLTANVGRMIAEKRDIKPMFYNLFYINFLLCGITSIMFFTLINDFIAIAFGKDLLLSEETIIFIILNMIFSYMTITVQIYKDASGIFWIGKYRPLATVIINIILSITFVKPFGINGVIAATAISRIVTTFWYDPYLVFKHAMKEKLAKYLGIYFYYLMVILICMIGIYKLDAFIWSGTFGIKEFILKAVLNGVVALILMIFLTLWMRQLKPAINIVLKRIIKEKG